MPNTARKANTVQKQKAEFKKYRDSFITFLKEVVTDAIGQELCNCIPKEEWNTMVESRAMAMRMQIAKGHDISNGLLKEWKVLLRDQLLRSNVVVNIGNIKEMNLQSYFVSFLTLKMYAGGLKAERFAGADKVKEALQPFYDFHTSPAFSEAMNLFIKLLHITSVLHSDLQHTLYGCKQELLLYNEGENGLGYTVFMHALRTETIKINLDSHTRIAYRVGFANYHSGHAIDYVHVPAESIFLPAGNNLPVYIQGHALQRLSERMDKMDSGSLHVSLFYSFKMPVKAICFKGSLLIPYYMLYEKAGYFTCEINEGRLILTTFLFLTNNNTPEGEKLYQQYQLTKTDKDYLAINKLSSFVASDLADNEATRQLFIDAGCESLFKISKSAYMKQPDDVCISENILDYLNKK